MANHPNQSHLTGASTSTSTCTCTRIIDEPLEAPRLWRANLSRTRSRSRPSTLLLMVLSLFMMMAMTILPRAQAVSITVNFNDPVVRNEGPLDRAMTGIRTRYDALPKEAKAATGAVVGYTGAKVAVGSATRALQVAGTVFVVSEVLHYSGALKENGWNVQHKDTLTQMKSSAKQIVRDCRTQIHQTFNPKTCRKRFARYIENDKYGPAGMAAGIIVGLA